MHSQEKKSRDCPKCMDLILKIRHGEITGAVLSCHPLNEIADADLARFIESQRLEEHKQYGDAREGS